MKIGFDAKRAFLNKSGLGNYGRTVISSLDQYFPENEYVLYTTKKADSDFTKYVSGKPNIHIEEPHSFIDKKLRARWRSFVMTDDFDKKGIDIYHGLSNELPFTINRSKAKKIVTIADLIFLHSPKLYPYLDRKIYNKKCRHSCDAADVIVAISEETKRDIEKYYFIPENKIKVIYLSCDTIFQEEYSEQEKLRVKTKYNLPSEYLLYVGTIEERKNLLNLVKALQSVKEIPLVVIGKKRSKYFETVMSFLKEKKMTNRVIFLENVPTIDLPCIYSLAQLFVYPSFLEGFGIPIIEALWSKTPVITSIGSCLSEAGGPGSSYIHPNDSDEIAVAINSILQSSEKQEIMIREGINYVQRFHPKKIATDLMELYTHLM